MIPWKALEEEKAKHPSKQLSSAEINTEGFAFLRQPVFWLLTTTFLLVSATTHTTIVIAGFLISFAFGVESDVLPYMFRRKFGTVAFGRKSGAMYRIVQLGVMIGPFAVASSFDNLGSYSSAFLLLAGCSAFASSTTFFALKTPSNTAQRTGAINYV